MSTLKGRIPKGSKFFPFKVDTFAEGDQCAQNLSPLYKMAENLPSVSSPLKLAAGDCIGQLIILLEDWAGISFEI